MPAKPKAKRTAKRGRLGYAIEHAAYHEAGHAVLALGAKPQFVGRRSDLAVPFVGG